VKPQHAGTPAVSVIICTYNRAESLRQTLETLLNQQTPAELAWEILVADNNSRDHTNEVVTAFAARCPQPVRYLFESQQGKSHALNAAVRAARAPILAFTDDDVMVEPGWLAGLWRAFAEPRCAGAAGRIEARWGAPQPRWFATTGPYRLMQAIVEYDCGSAGPVAADDPPYGANVAFRREMFDRYGYYRTDLGPTGQLLLRGEDVEFADRLFRNHELICYVPDAVVVHPVEQYRLRKGYFRRWYFNYGRTMTRMGAPVTDAKTYFGISRYLYRELAQAFLVWLFARGAERRFYYELTCCRLLGAMAETREARRRGVAMVQQSG
jgi:glycosyltransferase involved in cell wall biosynthesis